MDKGWGEEYFEEIFKPKFIQNNRKIMMSWDGSHICALKMDLIALNEERKEEVVKSITGTKPKVTS